MSTSTFLQSFEWEEFQHKLDRKTWRLGGVLVVRHGLPLGFFYLYCPRPRFSNAEQEEAFFQEAARLSRQEKFLFLKVDPFEPLLTRPNCQTAHSLQPQETSVISLDKNTEELLRGMHEKTRYNIRLAERAGVRVEKTPEHFKLFWDMLLETARRDRFHLHRQDHYQNLLASRSESFSNDLYTAWLGKEMVAGAIVNFYRPSRVATYLHGASGRTKKQVMAPQFLHWKIILDARESGFLYYDLGGTDEIHWPGLTRFKRGFGGTTTINPASIDIVYRPIVYRLYRSARRLWRKT